MKLNLLRCPDCLWVFVVDPTLGRAVDEDTRPGMPSRSS
jgi:hypothetical protein